MSLNQDLNQEINRVVQEIPILEETGIEPVATVVYDNENKIIRGYYYVGKDLYQASHLKDGIQVFLDFTINNKQDREILTAKVLKYDRVSASNEVLLNDQD